MPVIEHATHERTIQKEGFRYGCWNQQRPTPGQSVHSKFSNQEWPYVFSTECRGGRRADSACGGCNHLGIGDAYVEEVTRSGK